MTARLRLSFIVRHLIASFVTVSAAFVLWTLIYFSLFFWAVLFGGGLGSPVTYPIGLLAIASGGTTACLLIFLPSTALAECIARRSGFSFVVQIPLAITALAVLCHVFVFALSGAFSTMNFSQLFLAALLPFGFYWWIAQSGPIVASIFTRIRSAFKR